MFRSDFSRRGQVLIIFVFVIIGLVGITGLAVDGGNIYSDRRNAQNAADSAALHAAVTRNRLEKAVHGSNVGDCSNIPIPPPPGGYGSCASAIITEAKDQARLNGYNDDKAGNSVDVYTPPIDGPYATCSGTCNPYDYIEVVISTNVDTYFARVLGIGQLHNRVQAVALAQYSPQHALYGGNSLVELGMGHGSCPSDFNVGGNGTITLNGGGIFVNSSNPACAYKQTSCSTTLVLAGTPPASIQVVGGWDLNGCNSPTIQQVTTQYPFPPAPLFSEPTQCGTAGTFTSSGHTTTYQPGSYYSYNSFPVNNDTAVLNPGVYCINGKFQTNKDVTGNGVFFYIRPTGQISISGGDNVLKAPTTGKYAGYLMYADWDASSSPQNCGVQGSSASQYTGVIFAPYCRMTISGTSSSTGFTAQIIAYTLSLTGTNTLTFTYDASKMPQVPEINNTGLFR